MFGDIYKGKKVFVTGETGFKGSWLCAWLLKLGASVTGFSNGPPGSPANFEVIGLGELIRAYPGDVRDAAALTRELTAAAPDIVFHLAAQALVRESYDEPTVTIETNAMGVMNILEAIRRVPSVRAAVVITSDKCYRNDEWVYGYREIDPLGGADPYSASKACAEIISHCYFQSFFRDGPACATARAGNVIGGGDWAKDRIVPDCARAWARGEPALIRNPRATRPWQCVLEPLSGYLWLGARLLDANLGANGYDPRGRSYNFGPPADAVYTTGELADGLVRRWPGFAWTTEEKERKEKKESGLLKLCCDRALAELDWKAALNFEETLDYTAEWYARYYQKKGDTREFTFRQIERYENRARERGILWAGI
ncbi:MAG: CDP-glucose 4,6-dehydratase [Desulfovibrio sp.]|nr:CDP-glucose 4,6-dehydratase [Desulfovibrio sp.]